MNVGLLLAFWAVAFFLIIVPGPDWAYTLAASSRDGTVFPAVGGIMLGYAILTVIVAAGVGALVASNPIILTVLTVVGAGYLVYLGTTMFARPEVLHRVAAGAPPVSTALWVRVAKGVGVSGLNPKGLLLFLALLPQFTSRSSGWLLPVQLAVLGFVFVLTCGLFYSAIGLGAQAVLRTRPTLSRMVSRLAGVATILIGLFLLAEQLGPIIVRAG